MVKQVIVMRTDLKMRKGKMIAQGSHASLKIFLDRLKKNEKESIYEMKLTDEMDEWMNGLYTKISVGVSSEGELLQIYEEAKERGLPVALVTDSGLTEFHGVKTKTCLCIGPARNEELDAVTGHLKLL